MSKTRILKAVQSLDLATTRKLLAADPALLSVIDRQGRNLLHLACSASGTKLDLPETAAPRLAGYLLERGIDLEAAVGRDACTALFFAVARARNPKLVQLLLERGADPKLAPGGGLFAAGWWQDIEILKLLLRGGAAIDLVVGVTPFLACWCWRRFEAAKFLARQGADVNYQDPKGKTALHHGVERSFDPSLLRWLVAQGASPEVEDHGGVSPRAKAARKRDARFREALA